MNEREKITLKVVANDLKWVKETLTKTCENIEKKVTNIDGHLKSLNGTIMKHETTLYGDKSDKGLCGKVEKNASSITKIVIMVAIISAGVGGGTAELARFLGG